MTRRWIKFIYWLATGVVLSRPVERHAAGDR